LAYLTSLNQHTLLNLPPDPAVDFFGYTLAPDFLLSQDAAPSNLSVGECPDFQLVPNDWKVETPENPMPNDSDGEQSLLHILDRRIGELEEKLQVQFETKIQKRLQEKFDEIDEQTR
jgi:hypothetical protein